MFAFKELASRGLPLTACFLGEAVSGIYSDSRSLLRGACFQDAMSKGIGQLRHLRSPTAQAQVSCGSFLRTV